MTVKFSFPTYMHVYSTVWAIESNADNISNIIQAIVEELKSKSLATMTYAGSTAGDDSIVVSFRYQEDTVPYTLEYGDYLVCLPTGKLIVMDADTFEETYTTPGSLPLANSAKADIATLTV